MNYDYSKRDYLLPPGCKDLADVLALQAQQRAKQAGGVLHTHEEIRALFRTYFPAVAAGTVEIVALARNVGRRCLVAVRSHDSTVSAVASCTLARGERWNSFMDAFAGELPTVVLWDPAPEKFIRNTFGGLEQVAFDANNREAVVTIHPSTRGRVLVNKEDQLVKMLSELAGLVSELTGWKVRLAGPTAN